MFNRLKRALIGRPLTNKAIKSEKYDVIWGLPILSSDAISSVAYAGEEILLVLLPAIGILAYKNLLYISAAIISLLLILVFSYLQTIENYPNGGGAYVVASDNLGKIAGVVAGAALSVDYILTVAVSVSSGVDQITSAFLFLKPYSILICILIILILMIGNLRGIRESSRIFGIPSYAFVFGIIAMLIGGIVKIKGGYVPPTTPLKTVEPVTLFLLLRAFSNGCAAVTGIEAVSNAVPNFKDPFVKKAKTVLILLASIVLISFGGISVLISMYHIVPGDRAVIIQLADYIFGRGFMFYYITATTFIILVMASNTAYSGFPLLLAIMAKEGHMPRQLNKRGDRLSYSNGIILLSVLATVLIVTFKANVTSLIGLYAIGVFISFTLSQTGMAKKWITTRGKNWLIKAFINGTGAIVTAIVVIIIGISKFREGAWIVIVVIPVLVFMMLKINKHYRAIAKQLRVSPEDLQSIKISENHYRNRVIVPIESINKASIRALRYARTISDYVIAFNVSIDEESGEKIKKRYALLNTDIPLIVKYSPFRRIVEPLLKFIESEEYNYKKGDMITVILPQFIVRKRWHNILHNKTRVYIEKELLKHKHIVVATMPLQLHDDDDIEDK
ncbi:APC family permease [Thermoanaerobacterium sp. CMT5567-10]|uniref:APC family permease n=1 Tax=Thermoanaerobacterium sp. CMT5567-10 TaxID=3061989 RepID=UPI00287F45CA|nr:APC family permease [Thermoanaerobacterium sp. CMT5567-10]WKV07797.2 APC family permease [Thermoanaerobacterium sp. CMT5567-10]